MHQFAVEVAQLTHSLDAGALVAEKIASAEGSAATQQVVSEGADGLYNVIMEKTAAVSSPTSAHHRQVVDCVVKISQALGKQAPSPEIQHKLAAIVAADDALALTAETAGANTEKLAKMQRFGREFFVHLLRDIV